MASSERAHAAQDYALMNTHFEAATDPAADAGKRETNFRLADRYLREVMESTLQMMDASDGPQVAAVYDAMCTTADRMRDQLSAFEAEHGTIAGLDHAFDLDWLPTRGGWSYMGADQDLQAAETERIARPTLAPIDISAERHARRPEGHQLPGPSAERLARVNDMSREISELQQAISEREIAQTVDDPYAGFDH